MIKTSEPLILLTRPQASAERFAGDLQSRLGRVQILISPALKISYVKTHEIPDADALVFTSVNGVEGFLKAGGTPQGNVYCVGPTTAAMAERAGFRVVAMALDAERLLPILQDAEGILLHVRGSHVARDIAAELPNARSVVVYKQEKLAPSTEAKQALQGETRVILPLFSPRSARSVSSWVSNPERLEVVAMSKAVAGAFQPRNVAQFVTANEPTAEAMQDCIAALYAAG